MELEAGALYGALRDLWPVLAGLTVIEGLAWVDRRTLLGGRLLGGRLRLAGPGLRWAALGPLDRAYTVQPELVLLGPDRAYFFVGRELDGARRFRPDNYRSFAYPELSSLSPGADTLKLPDGSALTLATPAAGHWLVARILRIAAAKPNQRPRQLAEDAAQPLDERELARRTAALGTRWSILRTFAATGFLWSLLIPLLVYKPGLPTTIALPLTAGFLACHAATATAAVLLDRRLRRQRLTAPRGALLGALLYPPANLRAATTFGRELAVGLDPLAVLAAQTPSDGLTARLRAELWGVELALAGGAEADWQAAWRAREQALAGLLQRLGRTRDAALAPPERDDPRASHYCPICLGEFQLGTEECPDCQGPVAPFA